MQNLIPERVWLKTLNYKSGAVSITGYALSEDALNSFVERLENRSEFDDVILLKTADASVGKGVVKSFSLSMALVTQE